jgi:hypothetical protein
MKEEFDEFQEIKDFLIDCKYEILGSMMGLALLAIAIAIIKLLF